jgi:predicted nucleic acid-binding protein
VSRIRVVLDACVLLPYQLADLLLRLADAEMYEPLWSDAILSEVERNLINKFGLPPEKAAKRLGHMRAAFPNAAVTGYEDLVNAMTTDPKDWHVAAAAVRGDAAIIVTANTKDFPPEALAPYDVEVVHPDEFLQDQLDLSPEVTRRCLAQQRSDYTRPRFTFREFYLTLGDDCSGLRCAGRCGRARRSQRRRGLRRRRRPRMISIRRSVTLYPRLVTIRDNLAVPRTFVRVADSL